MTTRTGRPPVAGSELVAVRAWLRLELRRRWRSLAVLALLVAVAAATVLTAVAGARRAESAWDRLAQRTLPATAAVLLNQPGFDWAKVRSLPEVEALTTFGLTPDFLQLEGAATGGHVYFPPGDPDGMARLERPVVLAGRLADQTRPYEVVVTPGFPQEYGLQVGDAIPARLYSEEQQRRRSDPFAPVGPAAGPPVSLTIVGVVRSGWYNDQPEAPGLVILTHAFTQRHRAVIVSPDSFFNAIVRLRGGETDIPAFRAGITRVSGRTDVDLLSLPELSRDRERTISFEARSLLAFGAAALLAALLLVGQAVSRYVNATLQDLKILRALGLSPRQAVQASAAGPLLAASVGALGAVAVAAVASAWFPIGTAALLEPTPGIRPDWAVLVPGGLVVVGLVLAGAVAAAWLALGAERRPAVDRRSAVAAAAARAGLPVPVVVGTRFALESGRGRTAVPVRPALFGAVAGVLGILGAFTFSSGVADAAANPARFGQTFQVGSYFGVNGKDFGPAAPALAVAAGDADVIGVNDMRVAVAESARDNAAVTLFAFSPVGGKPLPVVLTSGRLPVARDEVALAVTTAQKWGVRVGDTVQLKGSRDAQLRARTVTGIGFVPIGSHNDHAEGGWVSQAGYDDLFEGFKYHLVAVALRPGADASAVAARLTAGATAAGAAGLRFEAMKPPDAMALLRQVQVLPVLLGIFLVVLALGAVGHALATAVRRRRHDLAVLRALGMTRWQSRSVVLTQATVLAAVGLVFGVPLGIALGRSVWRFVADYTPLQYEPPLAFWALLLVGPLALLLSNLLAAWPGQVAVRQRIGHVLRTE